MVRECTSAGRTARCWQGFDPPFWSKQRAWDSRYALRCTRGWLSPVLARCGTHRGESVGRGKVHMESWAFGKPVPDHGGFVGAIVIHDDVHLPFRRDVGLDHIQEL